MSTERRVRHVVGDLQDVLEAEGRVDEDLWRELLVAAERECKEFTERMNPAGLEFAAPGQREGHRLEIRLASDWLGNLTAAKTASERRRLLADWRNPPWR